MSRDLIILLILMFVGFLIGSSAAQLSPYVDEERAAIIGALSSVGGMIVGYAYLAIEKWDKSKKRSRARRAVYEPQVVGETCTKCSRRVIFVAEAFFCADCGKPFHRRCGAPPRCDACAASVSVANRALLVDLDYDFDRQVWVQNTTDAHK
jgi:hypothetical protein